MSWILSKWSKWELISRTKSEGASRELTTSFKAAKRTAAGNGRLSKRRALNRRRTKWQNENLGKNSAGLNVQAEKFGASDLILENSAKNLTVSPYFNRKVSTFRSKYLSVGPDVFQSTGVAGPVSKFGMAALGRGESPCGPGNLDEALRLLLASAGAVPRWCGG
jgi:hypothetical protein